MAAAKVSTALDMNAPSVLLNGIGHTFPAGHRIRLALSSAYWPWIWPQAGSVG